MKPEIVKADETMLSKILAIENASFDNAWTEKMLTEELHSANARFTCAFCGETLCGFLIAHTVLDECEIYEIAVSPEYRRCGIGTALLRELAENLENIAAVYLEVRSQNAPAIALYERFGFRRTGLRRGYYEKPKDDAILMTFIPEEEKC